MTSFQKPFHDCPGRISHPSFCDLTACYNNIYNIYDNMNIYAHLYVCFSKQTMNQSKARPVSGWQETHCELENMREQEC